MTRGVLDSTSTSSDFYTVFDNVVATNPHLNKVITEVRNETNIFLVKILRFYTFRDMAYVEELNTNKKYYCHLTHEMLSYEVSFNCMCDGTVKSGDKYGTYVKPKSNIYGIVANVRFKDNVDKKCLLSCLNYGDNNKLKSNVRNGEIRLVSGDSTVSITRERINLTTPKLFVNGLPYDEPKLSNYYDKQEISTTLSLLKEDTDAQLKRLNNLVENLNVEELQGLISEIEDTVDVIKDELQDLDLTLYMKKTDYINDLSSAMTDNGESEFRKALDNIIITMTGRGDNF